MLKPLLVTDCFSYVSLDDNAIDWPRTEDKAKGEPEFTAWAEAESAARAKVSPKTYEQPKAVEWLASMSLSNPPKAHGFLVFKDGDKPTKFSLGALSPSEAARIGDETGAYKLPVAINEQLKWRYFLACVRDVSDFGPTPAKIRADGIDIVDPAWLRGQFVRGLYRIALEIGWVAYAWNQLTESDAKK